MSKDIIQELSPTMAAIAAGFTAYAAKKGWDKYKDHKDLVNFGIKKKKSVRDWVRYFMNHMEPPETVRLKEATQIRLRSMNSNSLVKQANTRTKANTSALKKEENKSKVPIAKQDKDELGLKPLYKRPIIKY